MGHSDWISEHDSLGPFPIRGLWQSHRTDDSRRVVRRQQRRIDSMLGPLLGCGQVRRCERLQPSRRPPVVALGVGRVRVGKRDANAAIDLHRFERRTKSLRLPVRRSGIVHRQ